MKEQSVNAILKASADALVGVTRENDQLLDRHLADQAQLDKMRRELALHDIAWEASERGRIKTSSIRSWVAEKSAEHHPVDYYREALLSTRGGEAVPPSREMGAKTSAVKPTTARKSTTDYVRELST